MCHRALFDLSRRLTGARVIVKRVPQDAKWSLFLLQECVKGWLQKLFAKKFGASALSVDTQGGGSTWAACEHAYVYTPQRQVTHTKSQNERQTGNWPELRSLLGRKSECLYVREVSWLISTIMIYNRLSPQ